MTRGDLVTQIRNAEYELTKPNPDNEEIIFEIGDTEFSFMPEDIDLPCKGVK